MKVKVRIDRFLVVYIPILYPDGRSFVTNEMRFLFKHFIDNSDDMEPERIALKSGLVKEVEVFLEIGNDPVTRARRVFRRDG